MNIQAGKKRKESLQNDRSMILQKCQRIFKELADNFITNLTAIISIPVNVFLEDYK